MTDVATTLRAVRQRLAVAGSPSPRAEAERLVARALGVPWGGLWTRTSQPIDETSLLALERSVARRAAGEPLAYVEGSTVFHGVEIACGPGALVPRPETETLVDVSLELLEGSDDPVVVDVGTGTGAVAIAIASSRPDAQVWATDVSPLALRWARRNIDALGAGVRLSAGDLFGALPDDLCGSVRLVVSNPPYIADGTPLPRDVLAEPHEALFAGRSGDEVLLRLVCEARGWLAPRGALALEVGTPEQASRVSASLDGFAETGVRNDMTGRPRVVWARC